jgi:single-strand DNA-binding protein
MASLNRCEFIGNLGNNPETRYMTSGDAVTNCSIACNESWKDKNGDKQEKTEWVNLVFFGKLAEIVGQYLHSGSKLYVAGRMQTRKWQDKDGNDRRSTEIVADKMVMLDNRPGGEDAGERHTRQENEADSRSTSTVPTKGPAAKAAAKPKTTTTDTFDDEIPF